MRPDPIAFPARYPRGVVLQFPCERPMFVQPTIQPASWVKKTLTGMMLLAWLAAAWAVAIALSVFAWRAIH